MSRRPDHGSPSGNARETGLVIKSYSGWFLVKVQGRIYEAQPRGRLRRSDDGILTGDHVEVSLNDDGSATIEAVLPRKNSLLRPAVANVDQIVIVFSLVQPQWSPALTDRIAVLAEAVPLDIVFCINKIDLLDSDQQAAPAADYYKKVGYPVTLTDAKSGYGIEDLKSHLLGRVTVFAGDSGVGKSTLLNALNPDWQLATGSIGSRRGLGRHTTRHASLLSLVDNTSGETLGYVVDTPGFRRLSVTGLEKTALPWLFPEFRRHIPNCRFDDCLHRSEPGCAVQMAVDEGLVDRVRYTNYLAFLGEIEEYEANYYR